ncbi:MAG: NAD(P)-binding protein, partial [Candidatus Binatia bacterium]
MKMSLCIVGGGPGGVGLAWALAQDPSVAAQWSITIIHDEDKVGGHCATYDVHNPVAREPPARSAAARGRRHHSHPARARVDARLPRPGEIPYGLVASQSYVDRRGLPRTLSELARHEFVGMTVALERVPPMRWR